MKVCTKCSLEKAESEFYRHLNRRGEYDLRSQCKVCDKADNKARSADGRYSQHRREFAREHSHRKPGYALHNLVSWYENLKADPCVDCDGSFPSEAMHFDHIDPQKKTASVSSLVTASKKEALLDELMKCDLVCSNCHAIRTRKQRNEMPEHFRPLRKEERV